MWAINGSKRQLLKEQFEHERYYHFKLLEEQDYERRKALYADAYSEEARRRMVELLGNRESRGFRHINVEYLRPFLKGKVVVDIGCGYGKAVRVFSKLCDRVIGVEVDPELVEEATRQAREAGVRNASFQQGWATETSLPPRSVDVFHSNDMVEHLHPDDFDRHLEEAIRVLRPGGVLAFITASGLFGPSDISQNFLPRGAPAEGLHLFEPTFAQLAQRLKAKGFVRIRTPAVTFRICEVLPFKRLTTQIWWPIEVKVALERIGLIRRNMTLARLLGLYGILIVARPPA